MKLETRIKKLKQAAERRGKIINLTDWQKDEYSKVIESKEKTSIDYLISLIELDLKFWLRRIRKSKQLGQGVTIKKLVIRYGKEEGLKKWKNYCSRQAETNTFEYKSKKYGWSKEEFNEYNNSRSCTKENFIQRHGVKEGISKWNDYCDRQAYAGVKLEYFVEKYGKEEGTKVYNDLTQRKSHSLDGYMKRYDCFNIALEKYIEFWSSRKFSVSSKSAISFFESLHSSLGDNEKIFYFPFTKEYGKFDDLRNRYYFYDFVHLNSKTVVEFNGDFYHANPKIYAQDHYFKSLDKFSYEIWDYDREKLQFIENLGFKCFVVWESDDHESKQKEIINEIKKRSDQIS